MKIFLFLIVILFSNKIFAQINEEEKRVEDLLALSYNTFARTNVRKSAEYANKALILSEKIGYSKGQSYSYYYLAQAFSELGEQKKALDYLGIALKSEYCSTDPLLIFHIYRLRCRVYGALSYFKLAINEQRKGVSYISKIKNDNVDRLYLKSLADENISICYSRMGMMDSAYHYLNQKKKYLKTTDIDKYYPNFINTYNLFAQYFASEKKEDSAKHYLRMAIKIANEKKLPFTFESNKQMGNLFMDKNETDSALHFYMKALGSIDETNSNNGRLEIYKKISEVYFKKGNMAQYKEYENKFQKLNSENQEIGVKATEKLLSDILTDYEENAAQKQRGLLYFALAGIIVLFIILFLLIRETRRRIIKEVRIKLKTKKDIISEKEEEIAKKEKVINELEHKVNESFQEVIQLANENNPEFLIRFKEIYPDFIAALLTKEPNLRSSELTLCAYLFLGFNSKDIARITHKSISTIDNRKYNLRKKLNTPFNQSISTYFQSLTDNIDKSNHQTEK